MNKVTSNNFYLSNISNQLPEDKQDVNLVKTMFKNFSNFVFCDHITHKKYDFEILSRAKENHRQSNKHSEHFIKSPEKKQEEALISLLNELQLINRIKRNRNRIISRPYQRKSFITLQDRRASLLMACQSKPKFLAAIRERVKHCPKKQVLQGNICKQINHLSRQYLSEYLKNQRMFHPDYSKLEKVPQVGLLNIQKLAEVKQLINNCQKPTQKKQNPDKTEQSQQLERIHKQKQAQWNALQQQLYQQMREESFKKKHHRIKTVPNNFI